MKAVNETEPVYSALSKPTGNKSRVPSKKHSPLLYKNQQTFSFLSLALIFLRSRLLFSWTWCLCCSTWVCSSLRYSSLNFFWSFSALSTTSRKCCKLSIGRAKIQLRLFFETFFLSFSASAALVALSIASFAFSICWGP